MSAQGDALAQTEGSWRFAQKTTAWTVLTCLSLALVGFLLTWLLQGSLTPEEIAVCEQQVFGCSRPATWVAFFAVLSIPVGAILSLTQFVLLGLGKMKFLRKYKPMKAGALCALPQVLLAFGFMLMVAGF